MNAAIDTQNINKRIRLIMHLRTGGIVDTNVLSALEMVPRDAFVPDAVKDRAWEDMALPIGRGQTISQPLVVAIMTQALDLTDRDKVLEIGTGCGYQAAVLARLCRRVYTIERHRPLLALAEKRFEELRIRNITALAADGMKGWPAFAKATARQAGMDEMHPAPFDKIIVTAASRGEPPQALLDQIKVGGAMIIPVGESGAQMLRLYRKQDEGDFVVKDVMPVRFVPLLPDMAADGEVEA